MQLTDSLPLGGRSAPSRVLLGPHETNLGSGRAFSARHVAHYRRRAAGGAGILVLEAASVHPGDWPYERAPLAAECGPGWAAVGDACRPHGTVVLAGLTHTGGQGSSAWSQSALWGPSRVPDVLTREVPAPMGGAELAALVAGFAGAAATAVAAGLDGVEIDAGPTALLRQFLSPLTNVRADGYGADRSRLVREVLDAVRTAIGPDRLLALRLSVDECAPWAGLTPESAVPLVVELAPLVDLLTLVRGSALDLSAYRPDGHRTPSFHVELLRAAGPTPVVAQGSVVDVAVAAELLAGGWSAVEMTRALLADAELVAKVRAGTPERVRPCVLCNQACQVRDTRNPLVSCVVDPRTGYEIEEPGVAEPDVEATHPGDGVPGRPVVVAGAGPAGLEAARVLALRGHPVTVVAPGTGGLLPVLAALPGRERFGRFADWLVAECTRLGVQFRIGRIEHADVPTADVLATGGLAAAPVLDGAVPAADVLAGVPLPGGPVLVHDPVGGPVGVGVAELLAGAGRAVTIATPDDVVGSALGPTGDLAAANGRLARAGIRRETGVLLRSAGNGAAVLEERWTGVVRSVPCAVVVDAGHRLPGRVLPDQGRDAFAGDVVTPRTVLDAVLEGRRAALAVSTPTAATA